MWGESQIPIAGKPAQVPGLCYLRASKDVRLPPFYHSSSCGRSLSPRLVLHLAPLVSYLIGVMAISNASSSSTTSHAPSTPTDNPWDADPWLSLLPIFDSTPVLDASQAAAVSSFISYGRGETCTSAYSAFEATAAVTTLSYTNFNTIISRLPNGQTTIFSDDSVASFTEIEGSGDDAATVEKGGAGKI